MSIDSNTMNPNWTQPPKPGMSGAAKVLVGMGIGCGVMLLLCCGGLFGVGFYMQHWIKNAVSEDAASVRDLTASMAKIDVPEGLQPTLAFRLEKLPWGQDVGPAFPNFVVYADKDTESQLVLASTLGGPAAANQQQAKSQIDAMLREKGLADDENLKVEKADVKEVQIGGEKATFTISKGKSPASGKKRIHVTGTFQGNRGPILLTLSADAEKYSEETAIKMLESIQVEARAAQPAPDENPAPARPERAKPEETKPVKLSPAKPQAEKAKPSP